MRLFLLGATAVLSLTAGAALSFQALRPDSSERLGPQTGPSTPLVRVETTPEVKATARVTASLTPEESEEAIQRDLRPALRSQGEELLEERALKGGTESMPPSAVLPALPQANNKTPVYNLPEVTASVGKGPGRLTIQHASATSHRAKVARKPVPDASPAEPAVDITESLLQRSNR